MNVVRVSRGCCEPAGGERSTQLCSSANATTSNFFYIRCWSHSTLPGLFFAPLYNPHEWSWKKNVLRVDICGSIYKIKSNFRRVGPGEGPKTFWENQKACEPEKYYEAMSSKWKYCCESDSTVAGGGLACGVPGCAVHRRLTASTNYKLPKHCTPSSQVHCGHYRLC